MTKLTRREWLAGSAATAAALSVGLMPSRLRAAPPATGKQAPGFYRTKLGDYELTQVADGARTFPMPDGFIVNLPKDQSLAAAESAYMPKGQVTIPFNPLVVNTGSKLIVIDTGNGLGAYEATKGAAGQMNANMKAAGIDPNAVDIVLISHFHGDHIGGLKSADGKPVFPNAEIKVPAAEWAFWTDDANQAKANGFNKAQFANVKKMLDGLGDKITKFDAGKEVAPGITSIDTPGHTPGHVSFVIASGNARILVQSDVTNIPSLFLTHPDWQVVFDNDPNLAVTTRHKFFDMAAAEKAAVIGYHFSFPAVGHVEKDGNGYRLVPAAWNPSI
ncbi:MAG: MBL fold metallo-hydrolase [Alphaproteobacteria bacterium]|nr:MBL fold metallo-hydrolase [Alphaproteobacteria bacterium]